MIMPTPDDHPTRSFSVDRASGELLGEATALFISIDWSAMRQAEA